MSDSPDLVSHWSDKYESGAFSSLGWFQEEPSTLKMVRQVASAKDAIVDVGAGSSFLVDHLVASGFQDVTCLDLSEAPFRQVRARLGGKIESVSFVVTDLLTWEPEQTYDLWHDRAVYHFMTDRADRDAYRATLLKALKPGGHAIVATFAADGPQWCAGLPTTRFTEEQLAAEFSNVLNPVSCTRIQSECEGDQRPYSVCTFRLKA